MANPFDQFDEKKENPFDVFDETPAVAPPSPSPQTATPAVTRGMPPVAPGTEEIPTMLPRQRAVAAQAAGAEAAAKREAEEASRIPIQTAIEKPELFQIAKDYMRVVGQPAQEKNESNEDFFKRYMSHIRFSKDSILFGAGPQLTRLRNMADEDKVAVAKGIRLQENLQTEKGAGPALDLLKAEISNAPLYLGGAGFGGWLGKKVAQKTLQGATEAALKTATFAGMGTAEGIIGGTAELERQKIEQQTAAALGEPVPDTNKTAIATATAIHGILGFGIPKLLDKAEVGKMKTLQEELDSRRPLTPNNPTAPYTKTEETLADGIVLQMDKVHDEYMKRYGRQLIDEIDPANTLTNAKVKEEYSKAAIRVALRVIKDDPNFVLKPGEQVSSVVAKVIKNLDQVDDVALERALLDSNVTPDQFASMFKATTSEAGRQLGQLSRAMAELKKRNPELVDNLKNIYSFDNEVDKNMAWYKSWNGIQLRVNREWKVLLTSTVGTTARNTLSLGEYVSYKSAVQFMEGIPYAIGKTFSSAAEGARLETLKTSMAENVKNSFGVFYYLRQNKLAGEITDQVLSSNPTVRNNLMSSIHEAGNSELSAFTRWANSFNVAVDSVVRRALFTASLDRQLNILGKDLYKDYLIPNNPLPASVIKEAEKDALVATFSYTPKANDKTLVSGTEKWFSGLANDFISKVSKTAGVNFMVPFPRYMAGHMGYLYKNSPFGLISVKQELGAMNNLLEQASKAATKEEAERLTTQAYILQRRVGEKAIHAGAGFAMLNVATEYREKHPDLPWYELKTEQGSVDTRALGPFIAPYLAVGEVLARAKQKRFDPKDVKDAVESFVGLKLKAGQADSFITSLYDAFNSEEKGKKIIVELGKGAGSVVAGATQPFLIKQIWDMFDTVREEGSVIRDVRSIESEDITMAGLEAFGKQAIARTPLKEALPPAVRPLAEGEQRKEGEFFNNLVGFRTTIKRAPVESEIQRLNLDAYVLYGGRTGISKYDKAYTETANKLVLSRVPLLLDDPSYKAKPDYLKALELKNAVQQATGMARQEVEAKFKAEDLNTIGQKRYRGLSRDEKVAVNEEYAKRNNGKTMEEDKAWTQLTEYEALVRASTAAPTKTPQQQMQRLGFR